MILYIIIIERVYLYHVFLEEKTLKLSFVDRYACTLTIHMDYYHILTMNHSLPVVNNIKRVLRTIPVDKIYFYSQTKNENVTR